jgi:hypothetical protein
MTAELVPLGADEARTLTERIRAGIEDTGRMLEEAHDRRVWVALGYGSWEKYLRAEFNFSRARGYQLVSHARFLREVEVSTGVDTAGLAEGVTRKLQKRAGEYADRVRAEVDAGAEPTAELAEEVARRMIADEAVPPDRVLACIVADGGEVAAGITELAADLDLADAYRDHAARMRGSGEPSTVAERVPMPALDDGVRASLKQSIRRWGVALPIIVRPDGEVIDGVQRQAIAGELGVECPTSVVDVNDRDADEMRISLNLSTWHVSDDEVRQVLDQLAPGGTPYADVAALNRERLNEGQRGMFALDPAKHLETSPEDEFR